MTQIDDILRSIDAFVRKYYKNLLIRGALCAVGIVGTVYLAAVLLEHFGWLSRGVRGVIFWGGLAAVCGVLCGLVVRPLLKMYGHGKRISREEAARIIGRHFPEVSDKLLNLLQLQEMPSDSDLLLASIEQKTAELRPVPMLNAISLKGNRRYLKYAVPPVAVLVGLLVVAPSIVTGPTQRIAHYQTVYERPAPFVFRVLNDEMSAAQGADFRLEVGIEGEARPAEVEIDIEGRRLRMKRESADRFSYVFQQVQRTQEFCLEGGGVRSEGFQIEVIPNPSVLTFSMVFDYPAYTGRGSETVVNVGDAAVPEGTTVRWLFQTQDADSLLLAFGVDSTARFEPHAVDANGRFGCSRRVMASADYAFSVSSARKLHSDTLRYSLSAIADAPPMIVVEEVADSLHPDRRLFRGRIKDDYGFSRLVFIHQTTNTADTSRKAVSEAEIGLGEGTAQEFYFSFNTAELTLAPGDELTYCFEVADNDAIHGPKAVRSQQFTIKVPTADELDLLLEQGSTDARHSAETQMNQLQQLQEEISEMVRKLVDKKELDWQDRKEVQRLAEKQKEVRQMMQQMQQQIQENNRLEQKYRTQSEQLMNKQQELDRLMNEVMDAKMKETLDEIDKLMKELDKKKVQQGLEQLRMDNADLERQLDQNIALMKRLEVEKKVEQTIQKMDQLAQEQRDAAKETEQSKGKDREALKERQRQLDERFKQLEQEVDQIQQDYKNLDPPTDFQVPQTIEKQVEQSQQEAGKSLERGNSKEASKHQRQAADDMERLSEAIAEAQVAAEQQDLAEDAEQVRQLLKNLVRLSFNQEDLVGDLNTTYIQDPRYQTIISRQHRVRDDFGNVEDSLRTMARRQLQVASVITREVAQVNSNVTRSLNDLLDMNQTFYGSYKNTNAARSMQYSMTSLNNLALVLAESLDRMQDQMRQNSQRQKNGQCKNPGQKSQQCNNPGQRPSPKSMRQMQQELNRQMEALRKELEQQGQQQSNRHQLGQHQTLSEEFAKMAAQQEMIRRMMQQYGQEMKQQDAGNSKLAKEIDQMMRQMEQTETDLVNRTITQQTLRRQQQIMTRLLEHEKADMQREKEQRRESHEASDLYSQPSPAEMEKYNRLTRPGTDPLRTVPPSFSPYYRHKANEYFYR